jgi:large subunit ribosomal protein L17
VLARILTVHKAPHYHATPDHPDVTPDLIPPRSSDPSHIAYIVPSKDYIPPATALPKVFEELAHRYAKRPGGYTRIHRLGRRDRDNAPQAVVTLVDGPRDFKFEMIAKTMGRELAISTAEKGIKNLDGIDPDQHISELTRKLKGKALQFRQPEEDAPQRMTQLSAESAVCVVINIKRSQTDLRLSIIG